MNYIMYVLHKIIEGKLCNTYIVNFKTIIYNVRMKISEIYEKGTDTMKISILMGIALTCRESRALRDPVEAITMLRDAGYDTMDFTFGEEKNPDFILRADDWQQKVDRVADAAARLGITFAQSHLPYPKGQDITDDPAFKKPGYREYFDECMRRAYIASGMLGVKYATAHPLSSPADFADMDRQLRYNREYYDRFVELGIEHGVGTAFENMRPNCPGWKHAYRYAQNIDDVITLVDSYNDSMVGICWDTGHGNASMQGQRQAINRIGKRLRNLHINDNEYGMRDEHLLPYMGTIDWDDFVEGLVDVDYQGVLNYEVGKFAKTAPAALQPALFETAYGNGQVLLGMYEDAKQRRVKEVQ